MNDKTRNRAGDSGEGGKPMKKQKTSVERMREFFSFMLCRQAEELAAYAQDLLSEGLITPAEVDELNKSVLLAFGMTGEESAKVRERIDAKFKAQLEAMRIARAGTIAKTGWN